MRLRSSNRLSSDSFAVEPLRLSRAWKNVEVNEKVLSVLDTYAGTHVDIHPDDVGELEGGGRALSDDGRVVKIEKPDPKAEKGSAKK